MRRTANWAVMSLVVMVLGAGVASGCRDAAGLGTPTKGGVVQSILDSKELEVQALEALEAYSKSGDDSHLLEAEMALQQAHELLEEASKEWGKLLANGEIGFQEWKSVFDELKGARLNDICAKELIKSDGFIIEDAMGRIEVACESKQVAISLIQ